MSDFCPFSSYFLLFSVSFGVVLGHVLPGFFTGVSMMAPAARVLSTLTWLHAVKVALAASIEEICLAIGEVVGHGCILSASGMNSATVIFLSLVEKVNEVVEKGIVIDGEFVSVLPLSMPSKRVTLSNVPPFLSDEIIVEALSRYGKLVSPIKKDPD